MKIAFMHYHLKTGGVTTCLKHQVEAVKNDCDVCVVTGELPQAGFPAQTIHIPELAYSADYHRYNVNLAIHRCARLCFPAGIFALSLDWRTRRPGRQNHGHGNDFQSRW